MPELESCAFQLSLVALGDADPLERLQFISFSLTAPTPFQNRGYSSRTTAMFPEGSRPEMESGALQLSLVALGDRDLLDRRQSYSLSSTFPTPPKI